MTRDRPEVFKRIKIKLAYSFCKVFESLSRIARGIVEATELKEEIGPADWRRIGILRCQFGASMLYNLDEYPVCLCQHMLCLNKTAVR